MKETNSENHHAFDSIDTRLLAIKSLANEDRIKTEENFMKAQEKLA